MPGLTPTLQSIIVVLLSILTYACLRSNLQPNIFYGRFHFWRSRAYSPIPYYLTRQVQSSDYAQYSG